VCVCVLCAMSQLLDVVCHSLSVAALNVIDI
jgi:hypothetical protein